jgi:glutamyl-tRNA reductase
VDDLEQVIEENRASRREAAQQAEAIIDVQVEHYLSWWQRAGRQDALRQLRADGEAARDDALATARRELAAGEAAGRVVQRLAHQLTNRLLHAPSTRCARPRSTATASCCARPSALFRSDDEPGPAA